MGVLSLQCAIAFVGLTLVEAILRVSSGAPRGLFVGWFPGRLGLYPESSNLSMPGVVNWGVKTNSWGFRGGELRVEKAPGTIRIGMVGDSITDGFFVENESTYPAMSEARLRQCRVNAEVINAACGGGSIDRELAILRDALGPFDPDIVVLTFVTNDLSDLKDIDDSRFLRRRLDQPSLARGLVHSAVVGTAVGEWAFDRYLRWISPVYQSPRPGTFGRVPPSADRYSVPGGGEFASNSKQFMERVRNSDGMVLTDEFAPQTLHRLRRYFEAWDVFMDSARDRGIRPVFVYFPAYSQIYDLSTSMSIRDRLRQHSLARHVPFLDLTPVLRAQGARVLHLAPADYHLNPEGNRVIGAALADFLIQEGMARASMAGSPCSVPDRGAIR